MKKYFTFTKTTFFTFFGLGILILLAQFAIPISWPVPLVLLAFIFFMDIKKKNFARSLSYISGIVFTYVFFITLLIALLAGPTIQERVQRTQFDSASWKSEKLAVSQNPIRLRMVDDLIKKRLLEGKSKEQVDKLLGAPDQPGYFPQYDYVYWLGPERSFFSWDDEWLGVKFKNDIVVKADILRD